MALPDPNSFLAPCDPYSSSDKITGCDPQDKPGVTQFAKFTLSNVGGRMGGISRDCDASGMPTSEHKEGRAWDWMVDVNKPDEKAMADKVIGWLLATDAQGNEHAMLRRAGIMYLIWNRRVWSVRTKDWQPYTGPHPHDNHVHFSFGVNGANAKTSLYDPNVVPPVVVQGEPSSIVKPLALVVGAAVGLGVVYWATRKR